MGVVRRFAVERAWTRLPAVLAWRGPRRSGRWMRPARRRRASATAGVQRQHPRCAGRLANGINTVHLAYVREHAGHALIGARQWIPAAHIEDPAKSLVMGLPLDLVFRTKGQLISDLGKDAAGDGVTVDFACGDEVYGNCTELRAFFEDAAMRTCCASRRTSASPWPAGSPPPAPRRSAGCWRASGPRTSGPRTSAGGPLRREGLQGPPLVRLVVARGRLAAARPAYPPPPQDRRPGLSLLLRAPGPAADPDPADPRRRAELARRSRPPLLPVMRTPAFTAALLVLLPAFRRFLPGVVPSGCGCVAGRAVPRSRSSRICCSSARMIQFLPPGARRAVIQPR